MANVEYLNPHQIESFFEEGTSFKRTRRKTKKQNKEQSSNFSFSLKTIKPKTETQEMIFDSYRSTEQNMFLHGFAGTGKSFISLYLMLSDLLNKSMDYKKIMIIRSTVPSRDQGFLPGNASEKAKVYEAPYVQIFNELFGRSDIYELMKKRKELEFESTSYLRGTTFNDCLVFVDEAQNMSRAELFTVLTRVGENCRIVLAGDFFQSDLQRDNEKKGILEVMNILKTMNSVDFFEFKKEDIVRSGFVKELLIAESEYKRKHY